MTLSRISQLQPIVAPELSPWPQALWIGEVRDDAILNGRIELAGSAGFSRARLLVRHGRRPRGFVEVALSDGGLDAGQLTDLIEALPRPLEPSAGARQPTSVVLCTRDRPERLRTALESLLRLNYSDYEVVVVDNNPASGLTRAVVESIVHPRLRMVDAPRPGLSAARNVGIRQARNEIVAFTDDDVVVDPDWLAGIADGFSARERVGCVSGMVPSAEVASSAQSYFDRRVSWARSCEREVFSFCDQRPDEPLFPFQVARFGTGANFAIRRRLAIRLGGFDEAFGIGSATGGGEDIDMFVRVLLSGEILVYEPSAIIWHRHRPDVTGLTRQMRDYGTGLGAWFAQLALHPRTAAMMTRRSLAGIRHVKRMTRVDGSNRVAELAGLGRIERRAMLAGPFALARARLSGARRRPLVGHRSTTTPPVEEVP